MRPRRLSVYPPGELTLGDAFQFVVIAIRSQSGDLEKDPNRDYKLQAGDTIVLLVHREAEVALRSATAPRELIYRGARGS